MDNSKTYTSPAYLDCAATTPVDPRVADVVFRYMVEDFGNPHSRTHTYGTRVARAVEEARAKLASVVAADPAEVVFTSGATESNNLAISGLANGLRDRGLTHIVSTEIEHKAVLEPLDAVLQEGGFELTLVPPDPSGIVSADAVLSAVRPETGLISIIHVNNETGAIQPVAEIADRLGDHPAFLHTDAAQGFGKELDTLCHPRIDLISASGHKVFAPKGIGILVTRRRAYRRPPIQPRQVGGGQERGLRCGTVAAPLAIGFGLAAELAVREHADRQAACLATRDEILSCIDELGGVVHTPLDQSVPNIVSFRLPGIDGDAALLALKDVVAAATGSACTSARVEPSHVLRAMGLSDRETNESMRWSWGHIPIELDHSEVISALDVLVPTVH